MTERVPAALLAEVQRDLRPVRPLASPGRRALALIPLGVILLVGIPLCWRRWGYASPPAPIASCALSPLETVAGLLALAAAFREAIPGRALSGAARLALIAATVVGFLVLNALTATPPQPVALETEVRWIFECMAMVSAFSLPVLAVVAWLVARALPAHPARTGALCGLGVGVMGDAGLRLLCWDGDLVHVVLAHGGAIAVLAGLGALTATIVERVKRR